MQYLRQMRLRLFLFICALCILRPAQSQSPWYEPNSWGDLVLQMNETKSFYSGFDRGPRGMDVSNRYYLRGDIDSIRTHLMLADTFFKIAIYIPSAWDFNGQWLQADNPEFVSSHAFADSKKSHWGLYKYKSLFYTYQDGNSWLSVNPVLNVQAGPSSQWGNSYNQNTRGIELRGTLGAKVGFYSRITENQWFAPNYVRPWGDSLGTVPGIGWWRYFNKTGFDFFSVKGYINTTVVKNHVNAAFGHDKLFIGNGYRSLILSDFAKEYLFLRLNTQIGPFRYQNIFAQLNNRVASPGPLPGNTLLPKKYMAIHRASVLIKKRLEIGATEMVVFDRDSLGDGGFEPGYLNPVIFYRAVESNAGSRDNALIALDFKAYVLKQAVFYGQLLIDEFRVSEIRAGNGWWANKFGWQLGVKNAFNLKNNILFLQAEANAVKPYTYSHYRSSQSWTQYGQPLAHPLGANFKEYVFRAIFQPARWPRLRITALGMVAKKGNDSGYYSGKNWGGALYKSNDSRVSEYGNKMLQGNVSSISNFQVNACYMIKHNLYFDLGFQKRNQTGWNAQSGTWVNFGLRMNIEPLIALY